MLDEIQIINNGGVPLFYHNTEHHEDDDKYILQASFITALSQFADELQNGEVKLISIEKKNYLLKKNMKVKIHLSNG